MEDKDETSLPTLAEIEYEFLNGRTHSWRNRSSSDYHKVSASSEWYKYRSYLLEYPGTLAYDNNNWCIKTLGCGKRDRGDTLLLYRIVSLDFVKEKSYNYSWNSRFARDEENDCFYEICRLETRFFIEETSVYDKHFAAWHRDSVMKAHGLVKERKVTEEVKCIRGCRPSHCYCNCDDKNLKYEINEHSMAVEITVGYRTIELTLEEAAEVASFLASAKEEIKKKKIAALEAQQDELKKQLESVKGM